MASTCCILVLSQVVDVETKAVLRAAAHAHRALAELKGTAERLPNSAILLNTLVFREAKDSSAIENIITTQDELYKASVLEDGEKTLATKEVERYGRALLFGHEELKKTGLLRLNLIERIQGLLVGNEAGFRKQAGTVLMNDVTGEVVHRPPQHPDDVLKLLKNLEDYLHADDELDPLVRMALLHHQFEIIHPFLDGNGRTGRILNVLFLVKEDLLRMPILYLSRHIIRTKAQYFQLLQQTRQSVDYEAWLLYMLAGVEETAKEALILVNEMNGLMMRTKHRLRVALPKIYSQDLLTNLFLHPYTKIAFIMRDLDVSRVTATKYLEQLCEHDFVTKHKLGRENYYVNTSLMALLT
ncbi:MAG: Fic family protein [Deltaproteobacteria bacterium]|nr:Fic family protein [Deltaproteobacteria bacterium]